tara:strand:- start:375 stop:881 length:507 start_codon:yes stop_codon:yes gene_type:complete
MPATKDKKEYKMLEPGEYTGCVIKAEHSVSKAGNAMINTSIMVPHPEITSEDVTFVNDRIMLMPSHAWRLPAITDACDCEASELINKMKGRVVTIKVGVESSKEYGDKNTVDKWMTASDEDKAAFASRDSGTGGGGGGTRTKEGDDALAAILSSVPQTTSIPDDNIPF